MGNASFCGSMYVGDTFVAEKETSKGKLLWGKLALRSGDLFVGLAWNVDFSEIFVWARLCFEGKPWLEETYDMRCVDFKDCEGPRLLHWWKFLLLRCMPQPLPQLLHSGQVEYCFRGHTNISFQTCPAWPVLWWLASSLRFLWLFEVHGSIRNLNLLPHNWSDEMMEDDFRVFFWKETVPAQNLQWPWTTRTHCNFKKSEARQYFT